MAGNWQLKMQKKLIGKLLTPSLCRFYFFFVPSVAHVFPQLAGCVEPDPCASAHDTAQAANLKKQVSSQQ